MKKAEKCMRFGEWVERLYTSSSPRKCEPAIGCDFPAPVENAKQHTVPPPAQPKRCMGEISAGLRGELFIFRLNKTEEICGSGDELADVSEWQVVKCNADGEVEEDGASISL